MIKSFRQIYNKSLRESWGGDYSDQFGKIFDEEVPQSGSSKNMYGEIIRAVNRICYRYWNDGDFFFDGYGIETCGDAAFWLLKFAPEEIKNLILKMEYTNENSYDKLCDELVKLTVNIDPLIKEKLKKQPSTDHQKYHLSKEVIDRWGDPDENDRCPDCGQYYENCGCGICPNCGYPEDDCTCYDDDE